MAGMEQRCEAYPFEVIEGQKGFKKTVSNKRTRWIERLGLNQQLNCYQEPIYTTG